MSLITISCPLCKQDNSFIDVRVPGNDAHIESYGQLYSGSKKSMWKICGHCGFVHQNPRPSVEALNEFYLKSEYFGELPNIDAEQHLKFANWYYSEKIEYAIKYSQLNRGKVFDIGCGRGGVLKLFEQQGWKAYGVEPDKNLANYGNNTLGLKGVQQGILDSKFELDEKVDLIFSNHAFEHFADLDEVMKGVQKILKPKGYIFIAIPTYFKNKSSLSKAWMNSAHYSLFTHKSLSNLLSRYGFEEITHTYSGWKKEVDDLWYLAKYTGVRSDLATHYEDPKEVSNYLHVVNPLRSFIFSPIYSYWAQKVRIWNLLIYATKMFFKSPKLFFMKLIRFVQKK